MTIKVDKLYKRLVEIYAYKDAGNPVKRLDLDITMLQHGEKSRERAVLELALHLGLGISELRELKEQGLSEEETISEFLKGERLQLTEDDSEIQQIMAKASQAKIFESSPHAYVTKQKPTLLWYLVPLFFAIIGGLIGYMGVKEEDEEMAKNLLFLGFMMFLLYLFIAWILISRAHI